MLILHIKNIYLSGASLGGVAVTPTASDHSTTSQSSLGNNT